MVVEAQLIYFPGTFNEKAALKLGICHKLLEIIRLVALPG
jgi:hypothetical protein